MRRHIRKLTRSGTHSYYALLPPSLVRKLGWKEKQKLVVTRMRDTIQIRDWEKSDK